MDEVTMGTVGVMMLWYSIILVLLIVFAINSFMNKRKQRIADQQVRKYATERAEQIRINNALAKKEKIEDLERSTKSWEYYLERIRSLHEKIRSISVPAPFEKEFEDITRKELVALKNTCLTK